MGSLIPLTTLEMGEWDIKLKLEEMAAEEAGRARELRRLLDGYE